MEYVLACVTCGSKYNEDYPFQFCQSCGRTMEVVYKGKARFPNKSKHFWDYERLLPKGNYKHYEIGGTKLIESHESESIHLKLEIENPTNSFKDRGSVIEIGKAIEYGYNEIACASTGNMAFSLSYFSDLAGLKARIFISNDANKDKIKDIEEVGSAKIEKVNGDFNKAMKLAFEYAKKNQAFLTGDYCYRKEGQKTMAYEIMAQLPSATHIVVPVGNATLISGIFKALKQMKDAGRLGRLPKIVAVQSNRCSPLVNAFNHKKKIVYEKPRTIADAIAVGYPTFGEQALEGLRDTKGIAMTVSDPEMIREQKLFYNEYGLIAEPAGVAAIAALRKISLKANESAVGIISGGNI